MNKAELIDQAYKIPLGDLAKQILSGSYTPGVHDIVLVERCREATKKHLDKNGTQLEHGDFILWNPVDDSWLDIIIEHNGELTTLYELGGGELNLKDCLFGSENPVLKTGNIMTHHVELTHYDDL